MKKLTLFLTFIFFSIFTFKFALAFELNTFGNGARVSALGGSGLAGTANPFGNFLNPAGLLNQKSPVLSTAYLNLAGEVNFRQVNFNLPAEWGTLSFSFLQSSTDGIYQTSLDENGRPKISERLSYNNNLLALGFARDFEKFLAGAVFKYNKETFSPKYYGSGFNLDLGIIYPLNENQKAGLVLKNVLPGRFGIFKWSTGTSEKPPFTLNVGYNWQFEQYEIFVDGVFSRSNPLNLKAGLEITGENMTLRTGLEQVTGFGNVNATRICLGIGIHYKYFDFDYAYLPDAFNFENCGHHFSLNLHLDK